MKYSIKVNEVRAKEGSNIKGFATVVFGDSFKITNIAILENKDKQHDAFLATDCIGTEKLVSSEYNTDVFAFANTALRKLLADIQIEEQNHAEMIYKYKTANGMA